MSITVEVIHTQSVGHIGIVIDSESGVTLLLHRGDDGWEAFSARAPQRAWGAVPHCFALDPAIITRLDAEAGYHVDGEIVA